MHSEENGEEDPAEMTICPDCLVISGTPLTFKISKNKKKKRVYYNAFLADEDSFDLTPPEQNKKPERLTIF